MRHEMPMTLVTAGLCALFLMGCEDDNAGSGGSRRTGGVARPTGCGNDALDGIEPCDGTVFLQGATCADYGLGSGNVTCTYGCELDLSGCSQTDYCTANALYGDGACNPCDLLGGVADSDCTAACGADAVCANTFDTLTGVYTCDNAGLTDPDCGACSDGTLDGNELCDGTEFPSGAATCADYGYREGTLGCADCVPTFGGCEYCGDGKRNGFEYCDGNDLGGQSCTSLGFSRGRAACTSDCSFDTSGCVRDTIDSSGLADALCAYLARCESTLGPAVASRSACVSKFGDSLACEDLFDFPDQATADRCAAAIDTAACDLDSLFVALITCQVGELAGLGESCADAPCEPELYCDVQFSDQTACASCEPRPGFGEPCTEECDRDTWCDGGFCVRRKESGTQCDTDEECQSDECGNGFCLAIGEGGIGAPCETDDFCRPLLGCNQGFCAERVGAGKGCDSDGDCFIYAECVEGACADVAACSPPGTGGQGSPCSGQGECQSGLYCDPFEGCLPIRPPGGECTEDEQCGPGAFCPGLEDVCVPLSGVGGPCGLGLECIDGTYCDRELEQCRAQKPLGASCGGFNQCAEGFCLAGECSNIPVCQ